MKKLLWLALATMPLTGLSQGSSTSPRLLGIVDVEDVKLAIIQCLSPVRREFAFIEGVREGGVEVVKIDSTNRNTTAWLPGGGQLQALVLSNKVSAADQGVPGLVLEEVSLQTVLYLLGEFSARTILQHPRLPDIKFSLTRSVTNRNEAAQVLKNALSEKRIAVVPDGTKFLLVAPQEISSALNPHAAEIATATTNATKAETYPRGSINFSSATLANVLMIYAEFAGGKLDRTSPIPRDGKVFFLMQTALTKEECLYALETLVGWQGIKLVPTGTGLVKAVSTN